MIYDATYYSTLNVICYNPILLYRTCILFYRALILSYRALILSGLLFNVNIFWLIISCYSRHNVFFFTILSYRIVYQSYACILFYCTLILSCCALILSYCALILSYCALILHVSGFLFNFNSFFVYHIVSILSLPRKLISTLQVVQCAVYDNLLNKYGTIISSIISYEFLNTLDQIKQDSICKSYL